MKFKRQGGYMDVVPQSTDDIAFFIDEKAKLGASSEGFIKCYAKIFLTPKQVDKLIEFLKKKGAE